MSVESRKKLETLRDEIKGFLSSSIHVTYVGGTRRTEEMLVERILDDEVESIPQMIQLLTRKAELKLVRTNLTLFEDAVSTLESRIQEMLDTENETTHNQQT